MADISPQAKGCINTPSSAAQRTNVNSVAGDCANDLVALKLVPSSSATNTATAGQQKNDIEKNNNTLSTEIKGDEDILQAVAATTVHHVVDCESKLELGQRIQQLEAQQQLLMEQVRILIEEKQHRDSMSRRNRRDNNDIVDFVSCEAEKWPFSESGKPQAKAWMCASDNSVVQQIQMQQEIANQSGKTTTLTSPNSHSTLLPSANVTALGSASPAAVAMTTSVSQPSAFGVTNLKGKDASATVGGIINTLSSGSSSNLNSNNNNFAVLAAVSAGSVTSSTSPPQGYSHHLSSVNTTISSSYLHNASPSGSALMVAGEAESAALSTSTVRGTTGRKRQASQVTLISPTHAAQAERTDSTATAAADEQNRVGASSDLITSISLTSGVSGKIVTSIPLPVNTTATNATTTGAPTLEIGTNLVLPITTPTSTTPVVSGRTGFSANTSSGGGGHPLSVSSLELKASSPVPTVSASSNALTDMLSEGATTVTLPEQRLLSNSKTNKLDPEKISCASSSPALFGAHHSREEQQIAQDLNQRQQQGSSGTTPSSTSPEEPSDSNSDSSSGGGVTSGVVARATQERANNSSFNFSSSQLHGALMRRDREHGTPNRASHNYPMFDVFTDHLSCSHRNNHTIRMSSNNSRSGSHSRERLSFRKPKAQEEDLLDDLYKECAASTTSTVSPANSYTHTTSATAAFALPEVKQTCSFSEGGSLVEEFRRLSSNSNMRGTDGHESNNNNDSKAPQTPQQPTPTPSPSPASTRRTASFTAGMDQSEVVGEVFQDMLKVGHRQSLMENRFNKLIESVIEQRDKQRRFQRGTAGDIQKLFMLYGYLKRKVLSVRSSLDTNRKEEGGEGDGDDDSDGEEDAEVCDAVPGSTSSRRSGSLSAPAIPRSRNTTSNNRNRNYRNNRNSRHGSFCWADSSCTCCGYGAYHGNGVADRIPQQPQVDHNNLTKTVDASMHIESDVVGRGTAVPTEEKEDKVKPSGGSVQSGELDHITTTSLTSTPALNTVSGRANGGGVTLPCVFATRDTNDSPSAFPPTESRLFTTAANTTTTTITTTRPTATSTATAAAALQQLHTQSGQINPGTATTCSFPFATLFGYSSGDASLSLNSFGQHNAHPPFRPSLALPSSVANANANAAATTATAAAAFVFEGVSECPSAVSFTPAPSTPMDAQSSDSAQRLATAMTGFGKKNKEQQLQQQESAMEVVNEAVTEEKENKEGKDHGDCVSVSTTSTNMTARSATENPLQDVTSARVTNADVAFLPQGAANGELANYIEAVVHGENEITNTATQTPKAAKRGASSSSSKTNNNSKARNFGKVSPLHPSRNSTASSSSSKRRRRVMNYKGGTVVANVKIPGSSWDAHIRRPPLPPPIKQSPTQRTSSITLLPCGVGSVSINSSATATASSVVTVALSPKSASACRSPSSLSSVSPTHRVALASSARPSFQRGRAASAAPAVASTNTGVMANCESESNPHEPPKCSWISAGTSHAATTVSARRLYEALQSSKNTKSPSLYINSGGANAHTTCTDNPSTLSSTDEAATRAETQGSASDVEYVAHQQQRPQTLSPTSLSEKPRTITSSTASLSPSSPPQPRVMASATFVTESPSCQRATPVVLTRISTAAAATITATNVSTSDRYPATFTKSVAVKTPSEDNAHRAAATVYAAGSHSNNSIASSPMFHSATMLNSPSVQSTKSTKATRKLSCNRNNNQSRITHAPSNSSSVAPAAVTAAAATSVMPAVVAERHLPRRGCHTSSLRCRELAQKCTANVAAGSLQEEGQNGVECNSPVGAADVPAALMSPMTVSRTKMFVSEGRASDRKSSTNVAAMINLASTPSQHEEEATAGGKQETVNCETNENALTDETTAAAEATKLSNETGSSITVQCAGKVNLNNKADNRSSSVITNATTTTTVTTSAQLTRPRTPPGSLSSLSREFRQRAALVPPPLSATTLSDALLSTLHSASFITVDENTLTSNVNNVAGTAVVAASGTENNSRNDCLQRQQQLLSDDTNHNYNNLSCRRHYPSGSGFLVGADEKNESEDVEDQEVSQLRDEVRQQQNQYYQQLQQQQKKPGRHPQLHTAVQGNNWSYSRTNCNASPFSECAHGPETEHKEGSSANLCTPSTATVQRGGRFFKGQAPPPLDSFVIESTCITGDKSCTTEMEQLRVEESGVEDDFSGYQHKSSPNTARLSAVRASEDEEIEEQQGCKMNHFQGESASDNDEDDSDSRTNEENNREGDDGDVCLEQPSTASSFLFDAATPVSVLSTTARKRRALQQQ